jgi:thioredoxin reductase (NADPH)
MERDWDVIIIGGGPAGLSAAIYCGRALRKTMVLEKRVFGGQIVLADIIENYPGFSDPQIPAELLNQFSLQAQKYGAFLENDEVHGIRREDSRWIVEVYGGTYSAKAVIFAAGSNHRLLGVPGEQELLGRGLSVCATCDAPFFVNRRVAVLGGGDTALVEALYLTKFASEVTVVHRRNVLRAEKILQERAFKNEKIRFFWNMEVIQFNGREKLESIVLQNKKNSQVETVSFDGAFLAIGTRPNTDLIQDLVTLDSNGYVLTDISLGTHSAGLFVAGEVIGGNRRQVAISAGMGVQAALSCEEYLAKQE